LIPLAFQAIHYDLSSSNQRTYDQQQIPSKTNGWQRKQSDFPPPVAIGERYSFPAKKLRLIICILTGRIRMAKNFPEEWILPDQSLPNRFLIWKVKRNSLFTNPDSLLLLHSIQQP